VKFWQFCAKRNQIRKISRPLIINVVTWKQQQFSECKNNGCLCNSFVRVLPVFNPIECTGLMEGTSVNSVLNH